MAKSDGAVEVVVKACPFCGTDAERGSNPHNRSVSFARCPRTGCPGHIAWFFVDDWNRRHEPIDMALVERVAQLTAHRACGGFEHDPSQGKFHGNCVVCLVPWPCDYAGTPPART